MSLSVWSVCVSEAQFAIIIAAIVEWAYKGKSRAHFMVGVWFSEVLCTYVETSKHMFLGTLL